MGKLIAAVLIVAWMGLPALPGQAPDQKHIEIIQKKIAESIRQHVLVTVETYQDRLLQGSVSEAQADHFVLILQGASTTLTYAEVKNVTWKTHVSKHVWAVVAGAAVAGALYGLVRLLGGLRG